MQPRAGPFQERPSVRKDTSVAIANSIPVDHVLKHCIYCRQAKSLSEFGINLGMEVLDRVLSLMNGTPTSASHVAQKELTLT